MKLHKKLLIDIISLKHDCIFNIIENNFNFWDCSELSAVNSDLNEYFENDTLKDWKIKELKEYIGYLDHLIDWALKEEVERC